MQLHMPIICACFTFFNYLNTVTGYCITQFVKSWRQAEWIIFFLSNVNTACMFPSKDKDTGRQHLLYVWLRWSEGCDWWGQRVKEGGWHHRGLSVVLSLSAAIDVAARMKGGGGMGSKLSFTLPVSWLYMNISAREQQKENKAKWRGPHQSAVTWVI